ncbi:hypothetical protein ACH4FX_08505 [Streptomyces sp. NPDC018019]|uniref:hypothetical protein n=1 Tax=Streptomyces sp. NPDC018019 TaxID=3365030 RepID=UPI0037894221
MSASLLLHRAYCLLRARAYHVVLRTPRFRAARPTASAAGERHPERPQPAHPVRFRHHGPDRPHRSAPDRPHRRTKALAG